MDTAKSKQFFKKLAATGPETYILDRIKRLPAELKVTFLAAVVLAVLVHSFGFLNKFVNEDSLFHFGGSLAYLYQSGRWMLVALQFVRGFYTIPWIIGVFAVFYLALAVTLLVSVLKITNKLHCVLIAALIVSFPAWANQFMFDFMADAYPAAMLLAVLSVYLTQRYRFGFLPGAVVLTLSLALYQSFLAFAVGLSLMAVIRFILEETRTPKAILLYGGKLLLSIVLGLILYMLSVEISLRITGGALWGYQGMDGLGALSIGDLPYLLRSTYVIFVQNFLPTGGGISQLYVSTGLALLYGVVFLLMVYLFLRLVIAGQLYKRIPAFLMLLACLLLLPLGLNITVIAASGAEFHALMTNPFVLSLVLLFVLLDLYGKQRQAGKKKAGFAPGLIALAVTLLITGSYMRQTSTAYFVQHIQYENTFAFYNRMLARIEGAEGYEPGMPVAILGGAPLHEMGDAETLSAERWQLVGFCGSVPAVGLGDWTKIANFMQYYLGVRITRPTPEEIERVLGSAAFAEMPLYPRHGSVAVIDGVLVVKLNEVG
ncbi:MAG: glucosyltransferase domain-containing protein [Oscillospiraceae bacterium]|nr:glucosyltransferase domain-containing protein [Oscillospiraceae bacterium]